jgi:hypothetical protein
MIFPVIAGGLAEKLKGKGRKIRETIPAAVGARTRNVSAVARTAGGDFWRGR